YDSAPVRRAVRGLAGALIRALAAGPNDRPAAIERVVAARDALRERLSPEDYRYLEFQLWQEGVARFIEYAAALAAAGDEQPPAVFRAVPDYQPYDRAADSALSSLRRELERLDLKRDRRVAFYPIGAAIARLLDAARPGWKEEYARQPFALASLLWAAR
ncbi:MAG TPA: hypothetical protein VJQ46_03995, partial [Gemmatimonadales bacterium]|nr:hypothetical protein [Gemmatimonadales bacterium]